MYQLRQREVASLVTFIPVFKFACRRLQYHFIREFFDDSSMDFHYSQRINVLDGSPSVFSIINEVATLSNWKISYF